MSERLSAREVENWLARYGATWEARDAAAFAALFTPEAHYHWTPFVAPQRGRAEIEAVVQAAVATQRNIRFEYRLLGTSGPHFLAHWHCRFDRVATGEPVHLDGIFQLEFAANGQCSEFREWWHSDEDAG